MSDGKPRRSLTALLEEMVGVPLPDDPQMRRRLESELGLSFDDPATWSELERHWDAMRPLLTSLPPDPETDACLEVESVFQRTVERVGAEWLDPGVLASQPAGIRMLLATRAIEGMVDSGGWVSVFVESLDPILPYAIDGYRLIGLVERADVAEQASAHGFDEDAADDGELGALDDAWYALPEADRARAAFIRSHPTEFGVGADTVESDR